MATGFWVVKGDKTTCGGSVLTGHPKGKQIGPNLNRQATVGCQVSCGKHPGTYSVAGGYPGEYIHGQLAASTIYGFIGFGNHASIGNAQPLTNHAIRLSCLSADTINVNGFLIK